jgi:anti-anti-sigma factor
MDNNDFVIKAVDTTLYVTLGYELSIANSSALQDQLRQYQGKNIQKVVFDATDLVYISSSGIRAVMFAMQHVCKKRDIEFVNCASEIIESFEITGINNFFKFVSDERMNAQADNAGAGKDEWEKQLSDIRQEQLDDFAAHNDVVVYQMKLGEIEE